MGKMVIQGGRQLGGSVSVSGAKNSALVLLFASLLADGRHRFLNIPNLMDIESASLLLQSLECQIKKNNSSFDVYVQPPKTFEAHYELVRKMRASILCLGPLLAKHGEAMVSLPGGCSIGARPIDLHLEGLRALGAEIVLQDGYVRARAKKLKGANILFETVTVGGTENLMMAATLAEGTTVLENAAKEPEIVDLAHYLNKMGAKVKGAGTSVVAIEGVARLKPSEHQVMSDRIEAGTLLIAGAITGGEVTTEGINPEWIESLVAKLRESGFKLSVEKNSVTIHRNQSWSAVDVNTAPYPLFPTDLQAQFMSLMTVAEGTSVIGETVFENRFMHVQELCRMGANITPKSRVAVVRGCPGGLSGAPVMATDLRASACLVLAGLAAKGETTVDRIYHLDRGYEKLESKLRQLGANIKRG